MINKTQAKMGCIKHWYRGKKGYLMEGDYSAYVGKRITVHGLPESGHAERVLDVTRIE